MPIHTEDKTEPPTPRRRQEARKKGQVARSQDLTAAVVLLSGLVGLWIFGPGILRTLMGIVSAGISPPSPTNLAEAMLFAGAAGRELAFALAPLMVLVFSLGLLILFAQVGPLLTLQPIVPSWGKISPLKGIRRLFSMRSVMRAAISAGKLLLVAGIAMISMNYEAAAVLFSSALHTGEIVQHGSGLVFQMCVQVTVVLLVLAIVDVAWQRHRHEKELMMTKEEVKDELRSMEGDPAVRRRRRQLQMQLAVRRLQKDVPTADVVVTNPTHLAIAIRYDADSMIAPQVVAKGADYAAIRIRQIAAMHSIPIVERRPLARALYESVAVGQYIPERFYHAIAEILAYIYELTGRTPGGTQSPGMPGLGGRRSGGTAQLKPVMPGGIAPINPAFPGGVR